MNNTVTQLERYLRDTLGITPRIAPWRGEGSLPFFLRDRYGFYRARILGTSCVFMVDRGEREEPPAAIRKHVDAVQAGRDENVVYVREHITAYRRTRLVEQKLPFARRVGKSFVIMDRGRCEAAGLMGDLNDDLVKKYLSV